MENVRILVVDDHLAFRRKLVECLLCQKDIECVDEAADGLEALERLGKAYYDLMLTDIIMPKMDGFMLMDEMHRQHMQPMPRIIVSSVLARNDFVLRAISLGAKAYIAKPVGELQLIERIREVMDGTAPEVTMTTHDNVKAEQALDARLSRLFLTIGIPAHIKGYLYLRAAVKMAMENPDSINLISRELYPAIARQFDTTSDKVERAIRHAIDMAWRRERIDAINHEFSSRVFTLEDRPANGEFIAMIAIKIGNERIMNDLPRYFNSSDSQGVSTNC